MKSHMLKAIMAKKKPSNMSPEEQEAKMDVMKTLHKMASDSMGNKIHGIKKVTVASNTKPGLEAGIDKAKEIIEGSKSEEKPEEEMGESPEDAAKEGQEESSENEFEHMSEEELDQKLQEILAAKEKIKHQ